MEYRCPSCLQSFSNKGALDRHADDRVNPCAPAPPIADAHGELLRRAWQARDLLRKVGVTGKEALNCIVAALVLRALEERFPRLSDAATFELRPRMLPKVREAATTPRGRFSGIVAHVFDDGCGRDWADEIRTAFRALEYHPDTRECCKILYQNTDKLFPLTDSRTAKDLIEFVDKFMPFGGAAALSSGDDIGRLFMSIVRGMLAGKELGQFFTPSSAVRCLVGLCGRGRELGDVYDPTCGSGGFLAQAALAGAESVTGTELDAQVYLLAYANVLLAHGDTPTITRADTLVCEWPAGPASFDTVLANPPFGVKGLKWEAIVAACPDGEASYPMKTSTATGLFLQRIVRAAKVGGMCAVILPQGREVAGQAPADKKLRHALLRACDVKQIVLFPPGTFETTSIKTCALVMQKNAELGEVLKTSGVKRVVQGVDKTVPYATEAVELLTMGADGQPVEAPRHRAQVSIAELEAAGWSLSPDDYPSEDAVEELAAAVPSMYPLAALGSVCVFSIGTPITKTQLTVGVVPVVGGGMSPLGSHNTSNTDADTILISKDGASAGFVSRYPVAVFATSHAYIIRPAADSGVDPGYLFSHLKLLAEPLMRSLHKGAAQPALDLAKVKMLQIPLPPLDVQQRVAAAVVEQTKDIETVEAAAAALDAQARAALERGLYGRGGLFSRIHAGALPAPLYPLVELGSICAFKPGALNSRDKKDSGRFPFYSASAKNPVGFHDTPSFDAPEYIIFVKDGGNSKDNSTNVGMGRAWYTTTPAAFTGSAVAITATTPACSLLYLAMFLDLTAEQTRAAVAKYSTGLGHITLTRLKTVRVPLPPLEVQQRIGAGVRALTDQAAALKRRAAEMRAELPADMRGMLSAPADGAQTFDPTRTSVCTSTAREPDTGALDDDTLDDDL